MLPGGGGGDRGGFSHCVHFNEKTKMDPFTVTVELNKQLVYKEIDTGASATMINEETYKRHKAGLKNVEKTKVKLETYTGETHSGSL